MNKTLILSACLIFSGAAAAAEDWPCWRGPRGDGTSLEKNIPTEWNGPEGKNILWKVEVPGKGHASPIVSGERIFVATADKQKGERILLCLDRDSGRTLWKRTVVTAPEERIHRLNSLASSTPASNGKLVYVTFLKADFGREKLNANDWKSATPGNMVVAAYDLAGRQRWQATPGRFSSKHGYCSSPVLFEDLVIVNGDHDGDAYLVALERSSGKTVWKTPRENKMRSYCTPIIRRIGGRTQMVLSGSICVASFDPHNGKRHWIIDGPTEQYVASLVYNGELLFMTAGFPQLHIMGIRPDGSGDVTDTHVAWHTTKGCSYVPSPIVGGSGKFFLVVSDNGVASCFEAADGKRHWSKRIGPHYSASLVEADGLVHFLSDKGVTTIVRPGQQFEEVSVNELGENCYASPAISHGRIYIRAEKHLYCIGRKN